MVLPPFRSACVVALAALLAGTGHSEPLSNERIREGEIKQQQLKSDGLQLVAQLESMLDEFQRNELGGPDLETVAKIRDTLEKLSASEMQQVVDRLQKARSVVEPGAAKKTVAEAYTQQKQILVEIMKLLAEHRRKQQAAELAHAIAQLADRQAANLQRGIELGKWSGGRKPESFDAALQANLEGQRSEQATIGEELKMLGEKIRAFARDPGSAERGAQFKHAVSEATKVQANVDAAATALQSGQLFRAVADEKISRDALRRLARQVAPPQDIAEALRQAERELAKMVPDQKQLVTEAQQATSESRVNPPPVQPAEGRGERRPPGFEEMGLRLVGRRRFSQQQPEPVNLPSLENQQGDLANKSDLLAQDLEAIALPASQALNGATEKMREARAAMVEQEAKPAAEHAGEALANLERARAEIARQVALAEIAADRKPAGDLSTHVQQLKEEVHQLAQQQAAAAQNPNKTSQPMLAQKAEQLAQRAGVLAPPAAPAMQQAAGEARQAAQAAHDGKQEPAAAAQQAAARNLQQAEEKLAEQIAQANKAAAQLAAAQQAAERLAELTKAEQELERETAKAVAQYQPKKESLFQGQGAKQEEIEARTSELKRSLPPELAAAVPAIAEAEQAMRVAGEELQKPNGALARAAEQKALSALYRAKESLSAAAQAALGEAGAGTPQGVNEAAAQLAEAQQQLGEAQQSMVQAAAQQAGAEAAQQAAQAARQQAAAAGQPGKSKGTYAAQRAARQATAAAEQKGMSAAKQTASQMGQVTKQLSAAAAAAGQAASSAGMKPAGQQAASQAAQALSEAAAQSSASNMPGAQAAAGQAAQELAQAQSALSHAQAGLTPSSGPPSLGQSPPSGRPGQPGAPKFGSTPRPPGSGSSGTTAAQQYTPGGGEQAVERGSREISLQRGSFAGLPPRDRAAIEQGQAEKYPEEYGALVEQYLRNLADESSQK